MTSVEKLPPSPVVFSASSATTVPTENVNAQGTATCSQVSVVAVRPMGLADTGTSPTP